MSPYGTGGSAFPHDEKAFLTDRSGMDLRDYFAAKALSGISNQMMLENAMTIEQCELELINAATLSYRLADAMLAEREKRDA
jgi:hypothetical protein